jgi:prepilin-type N-terminal cleavage/methylation domain-containing protein
MISRRAFTLIELLVVIAIIGILAALLVPTITSVKERAKRATCLNDLQQINLGLRMYCDDSNDISPTRPADAEFWSSSWSRYRKLINEYVGVKGEPSPHDKLFTCPDDTFYLDIRPISGEAAPCGLFNVWSALHEQTNFNYSSYAFNGGVSNAFSFFTNNVGIGGKKLSSIKDPVKTVMATEVPAFFPYSWHQPGSDSSFGAVRFSSGALLYDDAKNMVSFVDGHVSFIKIFWNPAPVQPGVWSMAMQYDPPPGYDYKWSGD